MADPKGEKLLARPGASNILEASPASAEDTLSFNGIDGSSGEPFYAPTTSAQLATAVHQAQPSLESTGALPLVHLFSAAGNSCAGASSRGSALNERDLADVGWGLVLGKYASKGVYEALNPLLELRRNQASRIDPRRYHEFRGRDGYQPGDSRRSFLSRHCLGPGEFDPARVPRYLLIVGPPEEVSFEFQFELDARFSVGRVCFDTPEQYARYAETVVAAETKTVDRSRRAVIFGVRNPDDRATQLMNDHLASFLTLRLRELTAHGHKVERVPAHRATKARLSALLDGENVPSLVFTTSHGVGFPNGSPAQRELQGSLLCQDWPGPVAWRQPLSEDHFFSAQDLPAKVDLSGLISFHYACHSAGTPALDCYPDASSAKPRIVAPMPFVARLPQRLLEAGALAAIGHVERTWGYSFLWKGVGLQAQTFELALLGILAGDPVGLAMESFGRRSLDLNLELVDAMNGIRLGRRVDPVEISGLWTACRDARNYAILGDPAVRLPSAPLAPQPSPFEVGNGLH